MIHIGVVIAAILLLCVFGLLGRARAESTNDDDAAEHDGDVAKIGFNETEERFFSEVKNGKAKYALLRIRNQFDLMFVKSLFQSEHIPYYVEFENISQLRPGMVGTGSLSNYSLVHILDEDYDDAVEVIHHYLQTKKENAGDSKATKDTIRNVSEIILGNWKVPASSDTDGIEILYKK